MKIQDKEMRLSSTRIRFFNSVLDTLNNKWNDCCDQLDELEDENSAININTINRITDKMSIIARQKKYHEECLYWELKALSSN